MNDTAPLYEITLDAMAPEELPLDEGVEVTIAPSGLAVTLVAPLPILVEYVARYWGDDMLVEEYATSVGETLRPLVDANSDNPLEASIARLRGEETARVDRGDLLAAAEKIETFAGIDEGEYEDYDALLALAARLRAAAEVVS